jgi:hypothetical protein
MMKMDINTDICDVSTLYIYIYMCVCVCNHPLLQIALASGVSSLLSSMTVYPLEVIRSRIQVQDAQTRNSYRGIVDCISKMLRQEGVLAFYKVIPSNILYLSISSMVIV